VKHVLAALGLTLTAAPAAALSCLFEQLGPEGVVRTLPEGAVAAHGVLLYDRPQLGSEMDSYAIPGVVFAGRILVDGAWQDHSTEVTITGACINGDCGYAVPGVALLSVLEPGPQGGMILRSDPCAALPSRVEPAFLDALAACAADPACAAR